MLLLIFNLKYNMRSLQNECMKRGEKKGKQKNYIENKTKNDSFFFINCIYTTTTTMH